MLLWLVRDRTLQVYMPLDYCCLNLFKLCGVERLHNRTPESFGVLHAREASTMH